MIPNLSHDFSPCRKPHVNVGTIGHVDHGKTTLTAAITRVCLFMDLITGPCVLIPFFPTKLIYLLRVLNYYIEIWKCIYVCCCNMWVLTSIMVIASFRC